MSCFLFSDTVVCKAAGAIIRGLDQSPSCAPFSSLSPESLSGRGAGILFEAGAKPGVAFGVCVPGTKPGAGRHPRFTRTARRGQVRGGHGSAGGKGLRCERMFSASGGPLSLVEMPCQSGHRRKGWEVPRLRTALVAQRLPAMSRERQCRVQPSWKIVEQKISGSP